MNNIIQILSDSLFFGVVLSLVCYGIGYVFWRKTRIPLVNPLIIATILIILVLNVLGIKYESYESGAEIISYMLTPATICLAIPLYEKLKMLKDNFLAIMLGILSGIITSAVTVWGVCILFSLEESIFVTMLPKSVTAAIGMAISEENGGIVNITVAMIVITGIMGNLIVDIVMKLFRIKEPVAKGVAMGTASHVMGTAKALEMGETEGAMSGLSVAVAGLITVIVVPFLIGIY